MSYWHIVQSDGEIVDLEDSFSSMSEWSLIGSSSNIDADESYQSIISLEDDTKDAEVITTYFSDAESTSSSVLKLRNLEKMVSSLRDDTLDSEGHLSDFDVALPSNLKVNNFPRMIASQGDETSDVEVLLSDAEAMSTVKAYYQPIISSLEDNTPDAEVNTAYLSGAESNSSYILKLRHLEKMVSSLRDDTLDSEGHLSDVDVALPSNLKVNNFPRMIASQGDETTDVEVLLSDAEAMSTVKAYYQPIISSLEDNTPDAEVNTAYLSGAEATSPSALKLTNLNEFNSSYEDDTPDAEVVLSNLSDAEYTSSSVLKLRNLERMVSSHRDDTPDAEELLSDVESVLPSVLHLNNFLRLISYRADETTDGQVLPSYVLRSNDLFHLAKPTFNINRHVYSSGICMRDYVPKSTVRTRLIPTIMSPCIFPMDMISLFSRPKIKRSPSSSVSAHSLTVRSTSPVPQPTESVVYGLHPKHRNSHPSEALNRRLAGKHYSSQTPTNLPPPRRFNRTSTHLGMDRQHSKSLFRGAIRSKGYQRKQVFLQKGGHIPMSNHNLRTSRS